MKKYKWTAKRAIDAFVPGIGKKYVITPQLLKIIGEVKDKKILDLGSGNGYWVRLLSKRGAKCTGIEINKHQIELAEKNNFLGMEYIQIDATNPEKWGIKKDYYDIVLINHVLLEITSKHKLQKLFIIASSFLKNNGLLIVSDLHPFAPFSKAKNIQIQKGVNYFSSGAILEATSECIDGKKIFYRDIHWTLEDIIGSITNADFHITKIIEPKPSLSLARKYPYLSYRLSRPINIIIKAIKYSNSPNENSFLIDHNLRKRIHGDLLRLVDKTLDDKEVGSKIKKLMDYFNIDEGALKKEVLSYTLNKGVKGYVNSHYRKVVSRLTLFFHNLVKGTYHGKRHKLVLSFLRKTEATKLMDIGYGVPGPYLFAYLKEKPTANIILADQDQSAEKFARKALSIENSELLKRTNFLVYDMNTQIYPGDAQVFLYLDSIEHTKQPTEYLKKIVNRAPRKSYFIFSLPISKKKGLEGFHFAEWLKDEDAKNWVKKAGLKIIDEGTAYPNPEVDYFAEFNEGGYHSYLVLAQKIN